MTPPCHKELHHDEEPQRLSLRVVRRIIMPLRVPEGGSPRWVPVRPDVQLREQLRLPGQLNEV
jgi:hypothetical protein